MNRLALDETLVALADLGRLETVDSALIALCRSTADAVDASPGRASLVKEYRECLVLLHGLNSDGGGLDDFLARLAGTEMVDPA